MESNNLAYQYDEYIIDGPQNFIDTEEKEKVELRSISERKFQQYFKKNIHTSEKNISESNRKNQFNTFATDEFIENIQEEKKPVFKSFKTPKLSRFKALQTPPQKR